MKAAVVPIGNSKGIRIPKPLLEQCHIGDQVELEVQDNNIIIMPSKKRARDDWDAAFEKMHQNNDDKLLIDDSVDLRMEDWEW